MISQAVELTRLTPTRLALLAALVVAVVLAYLAGLDGPFLLDDFANVVHITPPDASFEALWDSIWSNASGLLRRPVSNLSFALNYLNGGLHPFGYKALNLALHVVCAFVVFLLARILGQRLLPANDAERAAWLIAATWALHPLHASTVLYVVQRMTQLSALFVLLACTVYANWRSQPDRYDAKHTFWLVAGIITLGTLGLLSKENAALLPALLGCLELFYRCTESIRPRSTPAYRWTLRVCILAPLLILALAPLIAWDWLLGGYAHRDFTLEQRLATQALLLCTYIKQIFLPSLDWLALFHDDVAPANPASLRPWLAATLVMSAIVALTWKRRTLPGTFLGLIWFLAGHLMESTVLPLELAWEHRNYLPSVGLLAGVSLDAFRIWSNRASVKWLKIGVALAVIGALSVQTVQRTRIFSSEASLAAHEIAHHPHSVRAQLLRLNAYLQASPYPPVAHLYIRHLIASEPRPVRAYFVALYASCSGYVMWPEIWGGLARARTAAFDNELLKLLTKSIVQKMAGRCELATSLLRDFTDTLLANKNFSAPTAREVLFQNKARIELVGGNDAGYVDLMRRASESNSKSFESSLQLLHWYMHNGRLAEASNLLDEMKRRRAEFAGNVLPWLRQVEADPRL